MLLQILQLVSGQNDMLESAMKEETIEDQLKVWMDANQEKQLANILDETKGWKKLANHFNFKYLLNVFEQNPTNTTLLLLNYIAVRFSFFSLSISCVILHSLELYSHRDKLLNYIIISL